MSSAGPRARGKGPKELRREAWPPNRAQRPDILFWPSPVPRLQQCIPKSALQIFPGQHSALRVGLRGLLLAANMGTGAQRLNRIHSRRPAATVIQSQPAATAPTRTQDLKKKNLVCISNFLESSGSNPRSQRSGTFQEVPRGFVLASNRSLYLRSWSFRMVFITLNTTPLS